MLHAPDVLHRLTGLRFGHPLYLFQQIGSTNDQAHQLAQAGAPEGLAVVAEEQTAGRGRSGRRWLTPPGSALALSVVLRPTLPAGQAGRLTMLGGLAACDAVEQVAGVPAGLKWPNDVLINGRKVAGLLVETAFTGQDLDYAVLGIGLNVSWAPADDQVAFPATSLEAEAGRSVDRTSLLRAILAGLEVRYADVAGGQLFADWRGRLTMLGAAVELETGAAAEPFRGVAEDVDPDGALLVRGPDGGLRRFLAADVHLRPPAAAR